MNRKSTFFMGLSFGSINTIWFIIEPLFFRDGSGEIRWVRSIIAALAGGLVSGILFGLILNRITNSKWLAKKLTPTLQTDETILFETGANHFKGIEAVGGRLYLTGNNLIFKSHRFNAQNHELLIPLVEIENVNRYKIAFVFNKGLAVTSTTGITEKFVVEQVNEWLKKLSMNHALQNALT